MNICIQCNKQFSPKKFAKKSQKYCSLKCRSKDYYNKYYEHYKWKKAIQCPVCGKEFILTNVNQLYCSIKCRGKNWKANHREYVLSSQRAWFQKDRKRFPEKHRWKSKQRKHLLREASGSTKRFSKAFTFDEWEEIKKLYGYRCAKCDKKIKLTIDHIIPLSKNGLHTKNNIQPLCHNCNSRKKDKLDIIALFKSLLINGKLPRGEIRED